LSFVFVKIVGKSLISVEDLKQSKNKSRFNKRYILS